MRNLNVSQAVVRRFAVQMAIAFVIMGTFLFFRHKSFYILFYFAGMFFLIGALAPPFIKPVYFLFMKLAFILEWAITRLILLIIFYLVFTPLGLVKRLFTQDPLDRKIEKNKKSYWKEKSQILPQPLQYEKQF